MCYLSTQLFTGDFYGRVKCETVLIGENKVVKRHKSPPEPAGLKNPPAWIRAGYK